MGKVRTFVENWYRPQWWARSVFSHYYENLLYSYFDSTSPEGFNLMSEEWDNCYLLDACRYDMFADLHPFENDLEYRISKASSTPGFLEANFSDTTHYDTVYVTANPMHAVDEWCKIDLDTVFHAVVDVWKEEWDMDLGTVPPERMAVAVREAEKTYPNKRLLAHFIQPHHPFIGPTGESITDSGMRGRRKALHSSADGPDDSEQKVWERLKRGEVSKRRVWRAYKENLELTFPHLESLLEDVSGRTVITSDHGNLIGEFLWPFPKREYGHPSGLYAPQLIKVPWLEIDTGRRRNVQSGQPIRPKHGHESDEIYDRLAELGYYSK